MDEHAALCSVLQMEVAICLLPVTCHAFVNKSLSEFLFPCISCAFKYVSSVKNISSIGLLSVKERTFGVTLAVRGDYSTEEAKGQWAELFQRSTIICTIHRLLSSSWVGLTAPDQAARDRTGEGGAVLPQHPKRDGPVAGGSVVVEKRENRNAV